MSAIFYPQDYVFNIESEDEIAPFFRPRDRKKVILPRGLELPMRVQYYFTWGESSGVYRYLLFKKPGWENPMGLVFRRGDQSMHAGTGRLCDWCHGYGSSDQIGLLTTAVNSKRTVGMMLCLDLSCGDKIENGPNLSNKDPQTLILQVCEKIGRFFEGSVRSDDVNTFDTSR